MRGLHRLLEPEGGQRGVTLAKPVLEPEGGNAAFRNPTNAGNMGAFASILQLSQRKDMPHQVPSEDAPGPTPPARLNPALRDSLKRYWRSNLKIMMVLLAVWAVAGLGCGVLFADSLNAYSLGGYPLGFWFAQQGSIIVFVILILIYSLLLNRLDARHHAEIQSLKQSGRKEHP